MRISTDILVRARSSLAPRVVVCDGDSITRGVGKGVTVNTTYPVDAAFFFPSPQWSAPNLGQDGETFATMLANFSSVIAPYIATAHSLGFKAIVSCAGGTNDIGLTTTPNPQTLLTTATSYFAAAKAAGADYTIGWTLMARTAGLASLAVTQSAVLTYNALLRAAVASKSIAIDYLIDTGNDVQVGNPTNVLNATVFVDGLHPTIYGTQVMGNLLASGVLSLGSRCSVTALSTTTGSHNGGSTVRISGTGFLGAKAVVIGGQQCGTPQAPNFQVQSDSLIVATVPQVQGTSWPWPYPGDVSVLGPSGCGQLRNVWNWT